MRAVVREVRARDSATPIRRMIRGSEHASACLADVPGEDDQITTRTDDRTAVEYAAAKAAVRRGRPGVIMDVAGGRGP